MRTLVCLIATLVVAGLTVPTSASVAAAASYTSPLAPGRDRVRITCQFWKTVKIDGRLERRCVSQKYF